MKSIRNNIKDKYETNYWLHLRLHIGWLSHHDCFNMCLTLQNQVCLSLIYHNERGFVRSHDQSWGKRLGNAGKIPFQPMEALISIEGQNQEVLWCYIKLRLNCVYPLLSSLPPKKEKERKGKQELCYDCLPPFPDNFVWGDTVLQVGAVSFPPGLAGTSQEWRTRMRWNE